mmetsp:Transcript_66967/g.179034  ORF Transcript_66967/g.179034 Transcript_66967/m.179034 type:complete len:101 (-) Transcript_66967:450-752(-)
MRKYISHDAAVTPHPPPVTGFDGSPAEEIGLGGGGPRQRGQRSSNAAGAGSLGVTRFHERRRWAWPGLLQDERVFKMSASDGYRVRRGSGLEGHLRVCSR